MIHWCLKAGTFNTNRSWTCLCSSRSHPLLSTKLLRLLYLHLDQSSVPIRRRRAPGEGRTVRLAQLSSQTHVSCCRGSLYQPVCLRSSHLENIPCVVAADGSSIQCQDASCPFREEQHRIALSIYIYSYSRLEEYTKSFYLRDIGKWLYLNVRKKKANRFVFEYSDIYLQKRIRFYD